MVDSLNMAVLFLIITLFCSEVTAKSKKPTLSVVSIDQCNLGNKRVDTTNEVKYSVQARKVSRQTTLLKTSFVVPKKFGPITFSLVGYQLQRSNVKDMVLKMDSMKCNNVVPLQVVMILKLKFDKDCNVLPNKYEVDNIDIQDQAALSQQFLSTSGKYAFDLEFWTPKGVVACVSFTVNFVSE